MPKSLNRVGDSHIVLKMKKIQLFALCISAFGVVNTYAQENTGNIKELGLSSTSLTSGFGVTYNWGKSDFRWSLRGTTLTGSIPTNKPDSINYTNAVGGYSTNYVSTSSNYNFGLNLGFEKYRPITEKLFCYWGVNIFGSYAYSVSNSWNTKTSSYTIQPGVGLRLGMKYDITPKVSFRADINPNVYYALGKATNYYNIRKNSGPNPYNYSNPTDKLYFNLTSTAVTFTISYRFLSK
jgi:hypothetical protein